MDFYIDAGAREHGFKGKETRLKFPLNALGLGVGLWIGVV
jgi:hypothetical protein